MSTALRSRRARATATARRTVLQQLAAWGTVPADAAWSAPAATLTPLVHALDAARGLLPAGQWVGEWERASRAIEDVDAHDYLQVRRAGSTTGVISQSAAWRRWMERVWVPADRRWMAMVVDAPSPSAAVSDLLEGWREASETAPRPSAAQRRARGELRGAIAAFGRAVSRVRFAAPSGPVGLGAFWGAAAHRDHEVRHAVFANAAAALEREAHVWDQRWRRLHRAWCGAAAAEGYADPLAQAAADQGLDVCVAPDLLRGVAVWWRREVAPLLGWMAQARAADLGLPLLTVCDTDALGTRMPVPPATPEGLWGLCRALWRRLDPAWPRVFDASYHAGWVALSAAAPQLPGWEAMYAARARLPTIAGRLTGHPDDVFALLHESGHALHYVRRDRYPTTWHRTVARDLDEVFAIGMEALGLSALAHPAPADALVTDERWLAPWRGPGVPRAVAAEWVWQQLRVCGQSVAAALWQAWVWRQPAGQVSLDAAACELQRIRAWLGLGDAGAQHEPALARLLFVLKSNLWEDVGYCFEYVPAALTGMWVWREAAARRVAHRRLVRAWQDAMGGAHDTLAPAVRALGAPSIRTQRGRRAFRGVIAAISGAPRRAERPKWARPAGVAREISRWCGGAARRGR